ncbi:MAG TPA: DNA gyrase inhibitor YacG [Methylophaga aminisulfidivorans]|uniref:DNA gyrase inhibitor YacG n=1 Tax=Methylophaga aminisulfidivorans TaxID=230105 RepID=A0A7C1ZJ11_9GAMM|nr:DNA gyrase inhibitor YacG [Methylophaga aminisulfidivorans]
MVTKVNCPQCGTLVEWKEEQKWRPFCSERCKLIDLGEWASEGHAIPGESVPSTDEGDSSNYH